MTQRPVLSWLAAGLFGVVAIGLMVAGHRTTTQTPPGPRQAGGPGFDAITAGEIQTILPEDAIPALVMPTYLSAAQASDIRPDELVIGVAVNGDARAYPLATLSAHEIVDDDIGGQHLAVTW